MKYIANSFSLGMLPDGASPVVTAVTVEQVKAAVVGVSERRSNREVETRLTAKSIVGYTDTAAIISRMLGVTVPMNREGVTLALMDVLYVAQYTGPRLPERCTTLPNGACIKWLRAEIRANVAEKIAAYDTLRHAFYSGTDPLISEAYNLWGSDIQE